MAAYGSKMTILLTRLFSAKRITEQIIAFFRYFMLWTFILGNIFLDPSFPLSYFRHCTQFSRGYHSRVAWILSWRVCLCRFVSFRFKAKGNLQCRGDVVFVILITSKKLWLSVCFNTFRNFNRSLTKRLVSHTQTITEWTAEKCLHKRVRSKQTPKQKLGNRTNRWWNVQAGARCPNGKSGLSSNSNNTTEYVD